MSKTRLMAIVNVTDDSFYTQSRTPIHADAMEKALKMQSEGADILDIGGESTRPGARKVSLQEELGRVIPLIRTLRPLISKPLSIDTSKPEVARAALEAGANWINDISGFEDPEMVKLAAEYEIPIVLMHMQGTPQTMQLNPFYPEGVVSCLKHWFINRTEKLLSKGLKKENIILDPGIGFGKTVADNLKIIHNLQEFKQLGFKVLLGISRKSFLGKISNQKADTLLSATLAINSIAIMSEVDIIRVHDVAEHRVAIDVIEAYRNAK